MTREGDEPRPPRRARPAPAPSSKPKPEPEPPSTEFELGEEPTTWRPSPAPPPSPRRPVKPTVPQESEIVGDGLPPRRAPKRTPARPRDLDADTGFREPPPIVGGPTLFERVLFGRVSTGHLATFCRQFAIYLDAGVSLLRALDSLQKQFAGSALGPVLERIAVGVRRGDSLHEGMQREPQAFDPFFLSMIRVAEMRGGVPETLRRMADHYEARQRLIRQARSALIYPSIVLLIATVVGGLLTIFVLPKLVNILADMFRGKAVELPLPTRLLISFSNFIQTMGWWALPVGFIGTLVLLFQAYRNPVGKGILDELSLYIPVLGLLRRKIDTTRFARTLSALLGAGVDYGDSLDLTADVLDLTPFRKAVRAARDAVMEGMELSVSLATSQRFTPDVIAIVDTGEQTGKLPETLERLADDYEEQVHIMVKNLSSLLQPILTLLIGSIVFFIALAFIMAMVTIYSSLSAGL
jgi:type II secretory pathway component PulF